MKSNTIALFPPRKVEYFRNPARPEQLGFWPLKAAVEYPPDDTKGQNYSGEIITDTGVRYFIRVPSHNHLDPFNELLAYEICSAIGIVVPSHNRIELIDGRIAFGSKFEGGSEDGAYIAELIAGDPAEIYDSAPQLSRLLAVDLFLANSDRSYTNVRWLPNSEETHRPPVRGKAPKGAVVAIDFGQTFFSANHQIGPPHFRQKSPSQRLFSAMRRSHFLSGRDIGYTFDQLLRLPSAFIDMVVSKADPSWINSTQTDAIANWWSSPMRGEHIELAERYVENEFKVSVLHN